jgi:hypothetical protein
VVEKSTLELEPITVAESFIPKPKPFLSLSLAHKRVQKSSRESTLYKYIKRLFFMENRKIR